MNNEKCPNTILDLKEYISSNHLSEDMFDKIYEDIQTRDILSSVLISVENKTVARLTDDLVINGAKDGQTKLDVLNFEDWRSSEFEQLANDYDRRRFDRSTKIDNLCAKVREHKYYSFIARIHDERGTDRVVKYAFARMTPDVKFILGTRQEITQSLEHDIITGGLNREGLLRELTTKIENCPPDVRYTLLCFNIKNFRVINELYGNGVGDRVLQHMYTSLVYSELRPVSYARFESDNFMCLIRRENLDTDAITRLCYREYIDGDKKIVFRAICGIYHINNNEVPAFQACAHAKLALSFIKDQFITPWMVYEHEMQKTVISDSEILSQIDDAMDGQEFIPYFQPVVDTKTGRIEMAEALVRWKSAKHGLVSPALFIPVLERHGGLSRIDQLMESQVFSMQQRRLQEGRPVIPIDLNLSWVDFADTKLIDQLQEHILDPSVPNDLVRFEITESAFDEIAENRVDVLSFFQKNNVKLLVDDFGQGYSFGTMKNVDFHIIKIDKSLIDKIGKSRKMDLLVETLISVFHNLNAKVVAEGVEDEKQVEFLRKVGCDYIQGFYFYRPMDEKSFLDLLEKQHEETSIDAKEDSAASKQEAPEALWVEREAIENQYAKMLITAEESKSLRLLLDEMDIHIFEWDVKTHVDIASDKFCKMYGLESNAIPNMPEEIPIVIEPDRERFRDFYARIARGEKMGSDSFRLYKPDGKGYTWYRKTFYTIFDHQGMPYKAIITMRDCEDEYRYRILRTRDRELTQKMGIVTFIYTLSDDTFSFNFLNPNGEVESYVLSDYLKTPEDQMSVDQKYLSQTLTKAIKGELPAEHIDFYDQRLDIEFRAHYTKIYGEYGQLYAIIGQAEDINKTRERLEAKDLMLRMASFDGLTQLYNRSSGEKNMEELLGSHQPGVFGILDCDKFKSVNDNFGHAVGDELLVAIAKGMQAFNPDGINMRLGGDEFAFYYSGNFTTEKLQERIDAFFHYIDSLRISGMKDFPVSVSVGAVAYDGQSDIDFDTIYRKADMLLYASKKFDGNKLSM